MKHPVITQFLVLIVSFVAFPGLQAQTAKKLTVLAPSGLNLRAGADANATKIVTVPYGETVTLMSAASTNDMTVDGLSGGMAKVDYQGKSGFMFSGYLSPISVATEDEDQEQFLARIREEGQEVFYEEIKRDYDGYYQSEYNYIFPKLSWQEAFLLARLRFNMPSSFSFPAMKGKATVTIPNSKKSENSWTDEMQLKYDAKGDLTEILYVRRAEGGGTQIWVKRNAEDPKGIIVGALYIAD